VAKFDITIVGAEPTNRVVSVFTVETVTESMVEALEVFDETVAPTFRIFVRTAEGEEFQAFTWCRDEASGIARAWREGVEFGHDVAAVWAEAI